MTVIHTNQDLPLSRSLCHLVRTPQFRVTHTTDDKDDQTGPTPGITLTLFFMPMAIPSTENIDIRLTSLSHIMRKPAFCKCENKGAVQPAQLICTFVVFLARKKGFSLHSSNEGHFIVTLPQSCL